jgi:hypothetical protein
MCNREGGYFYFYDIDFNKKKIEYKNKIYHHFGSSSRDLMKNSFHIFLTYN